jgi:hypothetical protein
LDASPPGWRGIHRFGCTRVMGYPRKTGKNRNWFLLDSFLHKMSAARINLVARIRHQCQCWVQAINDADHGAEQLGEIGSAADLLQHAGMLELGFQSDGIGKLSGLDPP